MTNKSCQKHKERLQKEEREKYQNLSKEEKDRRQKKVLERFFFLKNKSRNYFSI